MESENPSDDLIRQRVTKEPGAQSRWLDEGCFTIRRQDK
jgi:hypothetical protein